MPKWPPSGKSYPTEILGEPRSALVAFTDAPELFGGELRILGALDLKNGKIVRWVDYWDSRSLDRAVDAQLRQPPGKFVTDLKEKAVGENASPKLQAVAGQMQKAFAEGDAKAAASLVSYDATYGDMTLRTQLRGRAAIERYLARVVPKAPLGSGSKLRHVVGSDLARHDQALEQSLYLGGSVGAPEFSRRHRRRTFASASCAPSAYETLPCGFGDSRLPGRRAMNGPW